MRKATLVLALISALLLSAVGGTLVIRLGKANPVLPTYIPTITIKSDGTVTPETNYINRTGNIYTLTDNLIEQYSIKILCNNIVFDGAGHCINFTTADNLGLFLLGVSNVTVKNVNVFTSHGGIDLSSCSNCLIANIRSGDRYIHLGHSTFNTITQSVTKISLLYSENNLILRNNITELSVILCFKNVFSQNNILCNYVPHSYNNSTDQWDNGSIGNYWIDYETKHPNASEIGNTGIGNISYLMDSNNVDHHPLMYPFDIETGTIAFPTQEPKPEAFPVVSVGAAVVLISMGILILSWKTKPRSGEASTWRSQLRTKCSLSRVNNLFSHTTRWWRKA